MLLLGTDKRPGEAGFLTDTVIVVSVNTRENTANMLSIPRDVLVYAPGWNMRKINQVYSHGEQIGWDGGGAGLMRDTLLYNFGIDIDYYALVDLGSFQDIIDVMGYIEVPVDCAITGDALAEPRLGPEDFDSYEEYVDYTDPEENPDNWVEFTVPVGVNQLDGYEALWYARQRKGSSDFDRAYRQQQVLRAILRRAVNIGITDIGNIPTYYQQYNDLVQTDMGLGNFFEFAPIAANLDQVAINSYILTPNLMDTWYSPDIGQTAYVPRPEEVNFIVSRAMQPPAKNYIIQNTVSVEVRNGTNFARLDEVAADRLLNNGFDAVATGDGESQPETIIYDYTGSARSNYLIQLQRLLRVNIDNVIEEPDPNRAFDYVVVIGNNYRTCNRNVDSD